MLVLSKKELDNDYFSHARALKDYSSAIRKHIENRARELDALTRLMEGRKIVAEAKERFINNAKIEENKEIDLKMAIQNQNLKLNII